MTVADFVGRRREVELVLPLLTGSVPRALVIGGSPGVGKTRLVQEVIGLPELRDREVEWLACTASNASIPFAGVARLLATPSPVADPSQLAAIVVAATVAELGRRRPVIVVDDGHHLDDLGALLIQQVVLAGAAQVVVTVRSGERCAAALEALWDDRHATRMDLLPLSADESDLLLRSLLDGDVAGEAAHAVYEATRGNPLFVQQVVADGLEAGSFTRDGAAWTWTGTGMAEGAHVRESVRRRLGSVSSAMRALVAYVALAEPLALQIARDLLPEVDVDDGVRSGLVALVRSGHRAELRLAHPLFGEVLVAAEEPSAAARRRVEVADRIAATGSRRREDLLREAALRLQAGDLRSPVPFARAAEHAMFVGDLVAAERFASAAVDAGGSGSALVRHGEVLAYLCQDPDRAERMLRSALEVVDDDSELVRIAYTVRQLGFRVGEDRGADIVDRVRGQLRDPVWRALLEGHLVQELVTLGRTREGGRRAEELLEQWAHEPRVRLRLLTAAAGARALSGRTTAALELSESSLADALAHRAELPMAPTWVVSSQLVALLLAGRFDDAARLLDLVSGGVPLAGPMGAFRSLFAGRLAVARGRIADAAPLLAEATGVYSEADMGGFLRWALSVEAEAAALRGDLTHARSCAQRAMVAPSTTLTYDGDAARARAWVLAAEGRRTEAIGVLTDVAAAERDEAQDLLAAVALHDALRLGGGAAVLGALEEAVDGCDGELSTSIRTHAQAIRQGSAAALDSAAEQFAGVGQLLHAAEVFAHAALAFDSERLPARSARARRRARELLEECGNPTSPAFPGVAERARLTRREQEVVTLAAAGRTNREIAEQLYVSVRTAEGHLHRAMVKLGVGSREDLAPIEAAQLDGFID